MRHAAALLLLLFAAPAFAAELRVVFRCEPHASLTPAFRRDLRDRLESGLRAALGLVSTVEVIEFGERAGDPRAAYWKRAFDRGLERLEPPTEPAPGKTHFVDLRAGGSHFEVRSRQFDGQLGWISPATRTDRTADRAAVPRLILAQVVRDYGLTGGIAASDGDRAARVALPIDGDGSAWVAPGDLFALMQSTGNGHSVRVPNTLLRALAVPENGQVECRVESRYAKPMAGWEAGRFRAVLLGAERGPVRLRVRGGNEADRLTVRLSSGGMDPSAAVSEQGVVTRGEFTSRESYDRVAFVRISSGDRPLALAPVEILGDAAVTVELKDSGGSDLTDVDARICRSRLLDLLARLAEDNDRLGPLLAAGKNTQALELVKSLLPRLDDELVQLGGEVARLRPRLAPTDADALDRFLQQARDRQAQLVKLKPDLERAVAASNAPEAERKREALRALVARAEREVAECDIDAAIATYAQVLAQAGDWEEARKRHDELKSAWAVKSDEHRQARETVYKAWAKCQTADDVEKRCDAARTAFEVCRQANDLFACRKIAAASVRAAGILARRDEEIRQTGGDDAPRQLEQVRKTAIKVKSLLDDADRASK